VSAAGPKGPSSLLEVVEAQRSGCELVGSALYAATLAVVAADLIRGGPLARPLAPVADAPFGDAVLLRLLAGLHRLVLEGRAPELAAHYPSVGGREPPGAALGPALRSVAERHAATLAADMALGVQTNEPGRSATLLGGYLAVAAERGLPIEVLEVGASAGLNLLFDRYRYLDVDQAFGPPDSPLAFERPWYGGGPDLSVALAVADRAGCDLAPLDPTAPADRQRLRSYVWADQLGRLARLDAALEVAATGAPRVERADAVRWLEGRLGRRSSGRTTVVVHSIVLQYLAPGDRRRLVELVEAAGTDATPEAPLAWLRMEPGGDQAELRLTTWPGGRSRLLATSAYHGPPVVWRDRSG
jgi:hypothetical protein